MTSATLTRSRRGLASGAAGTVVKGVSFRMHGQSGLASGASGAGWPGRRQPRRGSGGRGRCTPAARRRPPPPGRSRRRGRASTRRGGRPARRTGTWAGRRRGRRTTWPRTARRRWPASRRGSPGHLLRAGGGGGGGGGAGVGGDDLGGVGGGEGDGDGGLAAFAYHRTADAEGHGVQVGFGVHHGSSRRCERPGAVASLPACSLLVPDVVGLPARAVGEVVVLGGVEVTAEDGRVGLVPAAGVVGVVGGGLRLLLVGVGVDAVEQSHRVLPRDAGGPGMVASSPGLRSGGGRDQKGGSSLNCPPDFAFEVEPAPEVARSGLAVAQRSDGPISSASISVTERRSPSGVSHERALSRPTTITRSPLDRLSVAFSASCRQALTRKNEVSPSFQVSPSLTLGVTATRKLATAAPLGVNFSSGASVRLPQMMVVVSGIVPSLWGSNER